MSVGIVTSCYGPNYYGFLDQWSLAILDLNQHPDWITIVHDGVPEDLQRIINRRIDPVWIEGQTAFRLHPQVNINEAIARTFTDWILKVDVDDLLLEHALDEWQDTEADVVSFGYRIDLADHPSRPVTAEQMLSKTDNPIGSCSPFRRWVWEANKFRDTLFDDWAFWIEAARSGAVFDYTGRVDYRYRSHPEQMTKRHSTADALAEIRAL